MVKREKSGSAGAGHEVAHTMPAGVRACKQQAMLTRTGLCQALGVHNRTDSSQEPLKDRHLDSPFIDRVQKSTFAKVTEPVSGRVKGGIQAARYQASNHYHTASLHLPLS